jgi:hypothetical protein
VESRRIGPVNAGAPGISLGDVTLSGGRYYYADVTVGGDHLRTILINFSGSVTEGV